MGRSEENRSGWSCRKVQWTDCENMTTSVNEHTFRVKVVSMSRFLKLWKKTGEEKGGWEYMLGSEFKQDKEGSKVWGECGTMKSTFPISFFLLWFSSGFMWFSLLLIHQVWLILTLLEDAVSFWNLSSDSQNYQAFLWTTHQQETISKAPSFGNHIKKGNQKKLQLEVSLIFDILGSDFVTC